MTPSKAPPAPHLAAQTDKKGGEGATGGVEKDKGRLPLVSLFRFASTFDWGLLAMGAVCAVASGASMSAFAIILGNVFNSINSPTGLPTWMVLLFVYVGLGTFVAAAIQLATFSYVADRMTVRIRCAFFASILNQDIGFFDISNPNQLASAIGENAVLYRQGMGDQLGMLLQFASMFISGIIVGMIYSWKLSLVILSISPLFAISGGLMSIAMRKRVSAQLDSFAKAGAVAEESFSLIRTVTALGIQTNRSEAFREKVQAAAKIMFRLAVIVGVGTGITFGLMYVMYGTGFWVGAIFVTQDRLIAASQHPINSSIAPQYCVVNHTVYPACSSVPVYSGLVWQTMADVCSCALCLCGCYFPNTNCLSGGDVVIVFFCIMMASFGIAQAGPCLSSLNDARIAALRIFEIIDLVPQSVESQGSLIPTGKVRGNIRFTDVEFSFPSRPDLKVLQSFSLEIKAGSRVALVGQSGCGKSTVLVLLQRFFQPQKGTISFDGVDVCKLDLHWFRSQIALVPQDPLLFSTTIMENVRFGLENATDEQVVAACQAAAAHDFITSLPDGYSTVLGQTGSSQLSGGQRQRLAIARAVIRDKASLFLFDEPTASLDYESERLVIDSIDGILKTKSATMIIIAHRLSSIRMCDKIVVLDKGRVVEEGTHEELEARESGMYLALLKLANAGLNEHAAQPHLSNGNNYKGGGTFHHQASTSVSMPLHKAVSATNGTSVADPHVSIARALRFTYPDRWWFAPAILASCVGGACMPVMALIVSQMFALFFLPTNAAILSQAETWALAFYGLAVAIALATLTENIAFGYLNGNMTARVREQTFEAILRQEMAFFDESEKNSIGHLTSKLSADAAMIKAAISDRIAVIVRNLATVAVGLVIAFIASWQVSLVVLATFPILVVTQAIRMRARTSVAVLDQGELADAMSIINESVVAIRTVKAFDLMTKVASLYEARISVSLSRAGRENVSEGLAFGLAQSIRFFLNALVMWYGAGLVSARTITFEQMNQGMMGVMMAAMGLGQSLAMSSDLSKGQAAVNSIFATLDRVSGIDWSLDQGDRPSTCIGSIRFDNVSFAFPNRPSMLVLRSLSLDIPAGHAVALCGQSGCGKSTVIQLLERFFDPDQGVITLDGRDIKTLNVAWLRSQIGLVLQDPQLLDASILENIRLGRPSATEDECIQASKDADAHDFISSMPEGYDSNVGERGSHLSTGQRQRISIARALVRKAPILLLDEATSALDEESQRTVFTRLSGLRKESMRTTLIIAHRLTTIQMADTIVVMEQGEVIDTGTFDELEGREGPFAALLQAQRRE